MIALSILSIGLILIFSWNEYRPPTEQTYVVSEVILGILSETQIKNFNNYYAGQNSILTRNGNITDTDKTMLEQVIEFYYREDVKGCTFCSGINQAFLSNITNALIPDEYNYMIMIDNNSIFNRSTTLINESKFITPSRIIVHSIYNNSEVMGPYLVEVIAWG